MFCKGSGEPTWAAVLAFLNVGFLGGPDPVLYLHPRFGGRLPEALVALENRRYDAEARKIIASKPALTNVLNELNFVSRDI